jgi:hypothetical protein
MTTLAPTDPQPVAAWAERIRPHLTGAVGSIIAAGRELIEAKAALPHGQFGPLLAQLGLSPQHAQRFMRVADHPVLSNASPGRHLPASVTVLDELTRVPDEDLADALDRGVVGPSTTREEARALRPPEPEPEPDDQDEACCPRCEAPVEKCWCGKFGDTPAPDDQDEPLFAPGEQDAILDTLHDEHGEDLDPDVIERAVADNVDSKQVPRPAPRRGAPAPAPRQLAPPVPERQPYEVPKPDLGDGLSHPARYSPELITLFRDLLAAYSHPGARVLDPFAGPGGIHQLDADGYETTGVELEPEWANLHPRTITGSALDLPFGPESHEAIVTSPAYGNRLADSHNASDPERRRSYTHDLGRPLHEDNSGGMHWRTTAPGGGAMGSYDYRNLHGLAWAEAVRVLTPGGLFVLNICDHYRDGLVQPVAAWHAWALGRLGLEWVESRSVPTRKLRQGANAELREQEQVHVFRKHA